MNSIEVSNSSINPVSNTSRRSFMKKSALTVGAVAILSQGEAVAGWGWLGGIWSWIKDHVSVVPIPPDGVGISGGISF